MRNKFLAGQASSSLQPNGPLDDIKQLSNQDYNEDSISHGFVMDGDLYDENSDDGRFELTGDIPSTPQKKQGFISEALYGDFY